MSLIADSRDEPTLRDLARDEPEAVRAVADRAGGPLGEWMTRILEEEAPVTVEEGSP